MRRLVVVKLQVFAVGKVGAAKRPVSAVETWALSERKASAERLWWHRVVSAVMPMRLDADVSVRSHQHAITVSRHVGHSAPSHMRVRTHACLLESPC